MRLNGAVVLVTGASRGIGAATADQLAARGATPVLVARDAAALADVAQRTGGTALPADLARSGAAAEVVDRALAAHGRLDGVVANAGLGHAGPVAAMTDARVAALVDLNVRGALELARAAAAAFAARPPGPAGRGIVFVTSVNQEVPSPWPHYAASKAAAAKVVEDLALELGPDGVRVNAVAPGRFRAAGTVRRNPDNLLHQADIPVEAVVNACLFLADPQLSPATTGASLRIDGGLALDGAQRRDGHRR